MTRRSASAPHAGDVDALVGLLREGYDYIGSRCARLGTDAFRTRLMLRPVICMRGADAARLLYDEERFTRRDAMPGMVLRLLQDQGSVATLDGEAHRVRKRLLLSLMGKAERARLREMFTTSWRDRLCPDQAMPEIALHDEAQRVLCESVHAWCGIPLAPGDVARRTSRLSAMIEGAATLGPRHWRALAGRRQVERELESQVQRVRERGAKTAENDPLHAIAFHRDHEGRLLDASVAAVELLNLLRPTVAIGRFIAFAAHALAAHPEAARALP